MFKTFFTHNVTNNFSKILFSSLLVVIKKICSHWKIFTFTFTKYCHVSRGTAGFDVSGRGYYFANQSPDRPPHYPPPPYEQAHSKPLPEYFNNIPNHHQYSPHSTPIPEFYLGKPAQSPSSSSSSNSHNTQTVSSGTIGIGIVDSGGGSSSNKNNKNNELDNKDKAR